MPVTHPTTPANNTATFTGKRSTLTGYTQELG